MSVARSAESESSKTAPRSIVLAAHGSLATDNSNQPLYDLAEAISNHQRAVEFFGDSSIRVTPAFLNGDPEMVNVLDQLPAGDVVVVPVMTSEGYYFNALPGKYVQNKTADQFQLFMASVVGVHPSAGKIIGQRVSSLLREFDLTPVDTTVVVVGHGTRRNKNSCRSTLALTESLIQNLAPAHTELQFKTGFLDQDPEAVTIAAEVRTKHTLVIPFLISRGPHTTIDVPAAFGLPKGPDVEFPIVKACKNGVCICDAPMAMYPQLATVCLELAIEAINGQPIKLPKAEFSPPDAVQSNVAIAGGTAL